MLSNIAFTDLYLSEGESYLTGVQGGVNPLPVPSEFNDELAALLDICKSKEGVDYSVSHNGRIYRVSKLQTLSSETYVLRRMPESVMPVDQLGIHPKVIGKIINARRPGLVLVSGAFGSGKTTTASALVSGLLRRHGGVAITIEDPPEMPLEGKHGEGVCYQTEVAKGSFGSAMEHVSRQAPDIIFLGEVRDAQTARQALLASINGATVICTVHADNVMSAIERMIHFSSEESDQPAMLLSQGLFCVLHQQRPEGAKSPKVSFLFLDDSPGARNMIAHRKINQLGSEMSLQLNRLLSERE